MKRSELESRLKEHAQIAKKNIEVPFDLKTEIRNMEGETMCRQIKKIRRKKAIIIAVATVLCIVTVTVTPMANSIRGFFRDITRIDGAITGTEYANATNDILITVLDITSENGNAVLPLDVTFQNKTEAPFSFIQEIAVSEYKILDSKNEVIMKSEIEAEKAIKGAVNNGKVVVAIPLPEALRENETYFIQIEKMYGLSKADAPLHITGNWRCVFKR
ncbi:MAG: DUF4179 domain-containing protein [Clostridia bacterium]|nr:DUF4179 domain-containing protein [Clostridia bacterium]